MFLLQFTEGSKSEFDELAKNKNLQKQFRAVVKALKFLVENPGHPSLHTHKYESLTGPGNADVFEAYAENRTQTAFRIFWSYYPPKNADQPDATITIIAIRPHRNYKRQT